jgi:hypothetical protein
LNSVNLWIRLTLILIQFLSYSASASPNLDLLPTERPQIRNQILECETYLVPAGQGEDSVGIPFNVKSPQEFRDQTKIAISEFGIERFRGGTFYVLGIAMKDRKRIVQEYSEILNELGLSKLDTRVEVLTVPSNKIQKKSVNLARDLAERLIYALPSRIRDYQRPLISEVISGAVNTTVIEIPNVLYLYHSLPPLDAGVTITNHAIYLGALTIYTKSMLNWLLRSSTSQETSQRLEVFIKQLLVSLPFVLNYNVFGRTGEILKFYASHGFEQTLAAFPSEMANFASTQGLTLVLQTVFYSEVITKGFGNWLNTQVGVENALTARAVKPWLTAPLLMLDSVVLTTAASGLSEPLFKAGPLEINSGHAGLLLMTMVGAALFQKFPQALNPTIQWYQRLQSSNSFKRWFKKKPVSPVDL